MIYFERWVSFLECLLPLPRSFGQQGGWTICVGTLMSMHKYLGATISAACLLETLFLE